MSVSGTEQPPRRIQVLPLGFWILLGFFLAYLLWFIGPVFLAGGAMQSFDPVPAAQHVGIDLKMRLSWSAQSFDPTLPVPDEDGTVFPPFANLLFAPLLAVRFPTAYAWLTVLTVLLYVVSCLWLPLRIRGEQRLSPIAVLICATGLLSYGLQFELERGQWNVVAVFLALVAVWIFHRHQHLRMIAYVLFVISVQLKLYPLVFIVMLVSDWRLWRENLIRLGLLVAANAVLFFVQGVRAFDIWVLGLRAWSKSTWIWEGNPSIQSAVAQVADFAASRGWVELSRNVGPIEAALSLVVILCLVAILLHAYRHQTRGPNVYYLLAAALGCLLIPSGGYDYRLSMLGAPLVLVLLLEADREKVGAPAWRDWLRRLAILLLSFAYATTLFPYVLKPFYLANNFGALFVMVLIVTILALSSAAVPQRSELPQDDRTMDSLQA